MGGVSLQVAGKVDDGDGFKGAFLGRRTMLREAMGRLEGGGGGRGRREE